MRTSEVLNRAADLIEEHGWTRGSAGWNSDPEFDGLCVEGALMAALGIGRTEMEECPAHVAVMDYIGDSFAFEFSRTKSVTRTPALWDWNDEDDRTQAEVIETLRAAALIEAAKETTSEFVITTSEAHCKAVARHFGLTPVYVGDRIYVTRWDDCRQTAFVYSARVRVGAV